MQDKSIKIKNYIEVNLQSLDSVKTAIKYNKENDYMYIITDEDSIGGGNLIHSVCVLELLRSGYNIININNDSNLLQFSKK